MSGEDTLRIRKFIGCERKKRHDNEVDADRAAARLMDGGAPNLRTYACVHCNGWHLTSRT